MNSQDRHNIWQRIRAWFDAHALRKRRTPEEEAERLRLDDKWRKLESEAYKERPGQIRF